MSMTQVSSQIKKYKESDSVSFLVEKKEIFEEILIFKTVKELNKQGFLSEQEVLGFREKYFQDDNYRMQIKSLFKVYSTPEEVEKNLDKIRYYVGTANR